MKVLRQRDDSPKESFYSKKRRKMRIFWFFISLIFIFGIVFGDTLRHYKQGSNILAMTTSENKSGYGDTFHISPMIIQGIWSFVHAISNRHDSSIKIIIMDFNSGRIIAEKDTYCPSIDRWRFYPLTCTILQEIPIFVGIQAESSRQVLWRLDSVNNFPETHFFFNSSGLLVNYRLQGDLYIGILYSPFAGIKERESAGNKKEFVEFFDILGRKSKKSLLNWKRLFKKKR